MSPVVICSLRSTAAVAITVVQQPAQAQLLDRLKKAAQKTLTRNEGGHC